MATFSENQVRHFYVVNASADVASVAANQGYLVIGGERTDLIENVLGSPKCTPYTQLERKTKVAKVTMDASTLDSAGNPIAGEDYILRIQYRQFVAQSDETFYHEFGSAHATASSTVSSVLVELAKNLALNTKKQEMVAIKVMGSTQVATSLAVTSFSTSVGYSAGDLVKYTDGKIYVFNATHSAGAWSTSDVEEVAAILVCELPQEWILGIKQETPVLFEVSASAVIMNGDEVIWGIVEDATATLGTAMSNTKMIADMEYFYHGERGDQYRNISWPQVIPTKYRAVVQDSVVANNEYDVVDIHYAYVGDNHSVQKSEKTLTIAIKHSEKSAVLTKINSALGTSLS